MLYPVMIDSAIKYAPRKEASLWVWSDDTTNLRAVSPMLFNNPITGGSHAVALFKRFSTTRSLIKINYTTSKKPFHNLKIIELFRGIGQVRKSCHAFHSALRSYQGPLECGDWRDGFTRINCNCILRSLSFINGGSTPFLLSPRGISRGHSVR